MSDDLFEGLGPTKSEKEIQKAANLQASYEKYQANEAARQIKADEEWNALNSSIASQENDAYTAIWIGRIRDDKTALQYSKHLCGTKVTKEQTLRVKIVNTRHGHNFISMSRNPALTPELLKDIAIFRLDAKQALMAKLGCQDGDRVIEDRDRALWNGFAQVLISLKQQKDMTGVQEYQTRLLKELDLVMM